MINFDNKTRIFSLSNGEILYCIYLNSANVLETLYFGEERSQKNILDLRPSFERVHKGTHYYDCELEKEDSFIDNYSMICSREEIGTHALDDKRYALIKIKKDGVYATSFRYISHKIYKGLPKFETGPHVHGDNVETISFTLKEDFSDVYLTYNISIFMDKNIIVKNFEIENKGNETLILNRAMSLRLDINNRGYDLHYFCGDWGKERNEYVNTINAGAFVVSSNTGRSSHEQNPFVFINNKDNSEIYGFNLVYSGSFKFYMEADANDHTHIAYGMNDEDFDWLLERNEKFITPQAVMAFSNKSVNDMSQQMHKLVKENIICYKKDKNYKEILFNDWEGCTFNFDTNSLISYIDDSLKIGTELFVLDDGWFANRNSDFVGLGDWYVNTNKVDLHKIVDYVHSKGLKFGLWFEPEMINPGTKLYKEHPEYVLGGKYKYKPSCRHQLILDFANPQVVDNIYNQMCKILDEYQIEYVKWDMNRDIRDHYSFALDNKHQGEVYHRYVLGYYSLIERILKRYPNLMIEGCASGGGRFDLGTLYYCPQIWCSDNTSFVQRQFINFNTSFGYPLSTMGSHASNNNGSNYYSKAALALFGSYGYEMNPNELTKVDIDELSEVATIYKKYSNDVINNGTLYRLISPERSDFMSMMSVSKDKKCALLIVSNHIESSSTLSFIKLEGLDETLSYFVSYDKKSYTGKELIEKGINLSKEKWNKKHALLIEIINK